MNSNCKIAIVETGCIEEELSLSPYSLFLFFLGVTVNG